MPFTDAPASASFKIETICVSVNRLRLSGTSWLGYRARNLELRSVYHEGNFTPKPQCCAQRGFTLVQIEPFLVVEHVEQLSLNYS